MHEEVPGPCPQKLATTVVFFGGRQGGQHIKQQAWLSKSRKKCYFLSLGARVGGCGLGGEVEISEFLSSRVAKKHIMNDEGYINKTRPFRQFLVEGAGGAKNEDITHYFL